MIKIKCSTPTSVKLSELIPFQGNLKKRSDEEIQQLANSLLEDGLLMPFAVWKKSDSEQYLLDGHGRLAALTKLAGSDAEIPEADYPCLYIEAETEEQAKKSLLQITSSYGHITKKGAVNFCANIPEYHAPAINKFVHTPLKRARVEKPKTESIIRISVPNDKFADVVDILKSISYIKVL